MIAAHYQWLEQLSDSITTGSEFEGSLNPDTCALGKWIDNSAADLEDYPELAAVIEEINKPHDEIHSEAAKLVELAKPTGMRLMNNMPAYLSRRWLI